MCYINQINDIWTMFLYSNKTSKKIYITKKVKTVHINRLWGRFSKTATDIHSPDRFFFKSTAIVITLVSYVFMYLDQIRNYRWFWLLPCAYHDPSCIVWFSIKMLEVGQNSLSTMHIIHKFSSFDLVAIHQRTKYRLISYVL